MIAEHYTGSVKVSEIRSCARVGDTGVAVESKEQPSEIRYLASNENTMRGLDLWNNGISY